MKLAVPWRRRANEAHHPAGAVVARVESHSSLDAHPTSLPGKMRTETLRILMADDQITDIVLAREALARSGIRHDLKLVHDGASVVNLLFPGSEDAPSLLPDLILLSLELADADPIEIHDRIRATSSMASVPVVMIATSGREEDARNRCQRAVNTYVRRAEELSKTIIAVVGTHWDIFALLLPAA